MVMNMISSCAIVAKHIPQVFPGELLQYTYSDPKNPKHRLARTEVQRRCEYIKLLHQQLGEQHPLVLLVKQCLDDEPSERPSAQEMLQQLEGMRAQIDPYQHLTKLEAMRILREKDAQLKEKDIALREKDAAVREKDAALREKDAQLKEKDTAPREKDAALREKDAQLKEKDTAPREKDAALREKDAQLKEKDTAPREKDPALEEKDAALREKDTALREKDTRIGDLHTQIKVRYISIHICMIMSCIQVHIESCHQCSCAQTVAPPQRNCRICSY